MVKEEKGTVSPTRTIALAFVLLLGLTIALQVLGGAWKAEFSGYPDEPAHFVTGLMIRDYIASGFPGSPVKFAENYYLHYPKVAFGMWGPLLHISEALWMLIFPPSHPAILLLTGLITALTAALLFRAMMTDFGVFVAGTGAVIFICVPTVQQFTAMAMADGLVALMDFCAALVFIRYLRAGRLRDSALFGVFACLSILAKGNGVALVLLPLFAMIALRRFSLLATKSFWVGAAIIALIGGPWQYYSARMLSDIIVRKYGWEAIPFYTESLYRIAGVPILVLAIGGLIASVVLPWKSRKVEPKWACMAGLLLAIFVFHCLMPTSGGDRRYFIALVPPMVMFAAAGLQYLLRVARSWIRVPDSGAAIAVTLAALFFSTAFRIPQKRYFGFDKVADELERPAYKDSIILISSEGEAEGLLISEMAMREHRPGHILLRATKMIGQSDWNGERYLLLRDTPEKVLAWLRSVPVELIVLDTTKLYTSRHHELIKETLNQYPDAFELLGRYPAAGPGKDLIQLYRVKGVSSKNHGRIRIDLPFTLGRSIGSE